MKFIKKYAGLAILLLGITLLVVLHVLHLNFINMLLLLSLGLMIVGFTLHVWARKSESRY